ncbi:MAG: hypothetical protein NUW01_04495 [Gemmatimonadaceae bacterium]|nr:hypothetical protein [Gemmatimonadaceae bacterium]
MRVVGGFIYLNLTACILLPALVMGFGGAPLFAWFLIYGAEAVGIVIGVYFGTRR